MQGSEKPEVQPEQRMSVSLAGGSVSDLSFLAAPREGASLPRPESEPVISKKEGPRVLIVDDVDGNRDAIGRALLRETKTNYKDRISLVTNVDDAYELFMKASNEGDPFAVIIMDYEMPSREDPRISKNGGEGVDLIRRFERENGIHRTYIVGYSSDPGNFTGCDVDVNMEKPALPKDLREAVFNGCAAYAARRASVSVPSTTATISVPAPSSLEGETPSRSLANS